LVNISVIKRVLLQDMPESERLGFLEHLDGSTDLHLTPEIVASIEPMDDEAFEIVWQMWKLSADKVLDLYADKFELFATLNPSLSAAITRMSNRGAVAA
jgi:hypothetical protein